MNFISESPLISDKTYKIVLAIVGIILFLTLLFFAKDAYNGVVLKLKLCLYVQFFAIILLQINAFLAKKMNHIKYYAIGGMVFLFISTFYLDNFFFGSLAGNFLRSFIAFSIIQLSLLFYSENLNVIDR